MIIGIVAVSQNNAIGRGGKLPWHYPADLKFFKRATIGNAVVMGSTTWRAIGKPLQGRLNIVLSRDCSPLAGAVVLSSPDDVLGLADYLRCDAYIIGGAATYLAFADKIDKWFVTEVPVTVDDADTFMPADFLDGFSDVESIDLGDGLAAKVFDRS